VGASHAFSRPWTALPGQRIFGSESSRGGLNKTEIPRKQAISTKKRIREAEAKMGSRRPMIAEWRLSGDAVLG
jgi:hypothetical protein